MNFFKQLMQHGHNEAQITSSSPVDPQAIVHAITKSHVTTANFQKLDFHVAQLFAYATVCVDMNPPSLETFLLKAGEWALSSDLEERMKAFLIFSTFKDHDPRATRGIHEVEIPTIFL